MKTILVQFPNFLGDSINALPALELIKQEYPEARIIISGPPFLSGLLDHDRAIEKMLLYSPKERKKWFFPCKMAYALRKEKVDLGILFTNTFKSALALWLGGVKVRVGYKNEARRMLLTFSLRRNRNKHYINAYAGLVNAFLQYKYTTLTPPRLWPGSAAPFVFQSEAPIIGLYLGGENKKKRRLPEHTACALLEGLDKLGYSLVLLGDKNDVEAHRRVVERAHPRSFTDLTGKTTIRQYIDAIAHCTVMVTIDSAALHIAAAVDTPFVGLMGLSTSPTSCIAPKTNRGVLLKVENNLIQEEDYIQNLTADLIILEVQKWIPTTSCRP